MRQFFVTEKVHESMIKVKLKWNVNHEKLLSCLSLIVTYASSESWKKTRKSSKPHLRGKLEKLRALAAGRQPRVWPIISTYRNVIPSARANAEATERGSTRLKLFCPSHAPAAAPLLCRRRPRRLTDIFTGFAWTYILRAGPRSTWVGKISMTNFPTVGWTLFIDKGWRESRLQCAGYRSSVCFANRAPPMHYKFHDKRSRVYCNCAARH